MIEEIEDQFLDACEAHQTTYAETKFLADVWDRIVRSADGEEDAETSQAELDALHSTHEKTYDAEAETLKHEYENLDDEIAARFTELERLAAQAKDPKITLRSVTLIVEEAAALRDKIDKLTNLNLVQKISEIRDEQLRRETEGVETRLAETKREIHEQEQVRERIESIKNRRENLTQRSEISAEELGLLLERLQEKVFKTEPR